MYFSQVNFLIIGVSNFCKIIEDKNLYRQRDVESQEVRRYLKYSWWRLVLRLLECLSEVSGRRGVVRHQVFAFS